MPVSRILLVILLFFPLTFIFPESFRTVINGSLDVSADNISGSGVNLGINNSVLINLNNDTRFFKGIEIEITAPQAWLSYTGSLVVAAYNNLKDPVSSGIADIDGSRIAFEPLPGKIRTVYQIPIRQSHGLRTTPYITVPTGVIRPASFPVLFRFMLVVKGTNEELENMNFNLAVRPVLSDEGAVRLIPRYPPQQRGKPFTVLIDDTLIENINQEQVLKEGEHHLVILSEDFRNESRHFIIEKAKILELAFELQDPTPVIIFEGPQNAGIFLDDTEIPRDREPVTVEPGQHEIKFKIGDYTIIKTLNILRGKTYHVALSVDLTINETD
ncbi:MAG: hypothetical protein LBB81_01740 [Treponema sp.]|nr:hypothetical protein [Treponema sp.]